MPIFEYECRSCHRQFERIVGVMDQDDPLTCPQCGGLGVTRKISAATIVRSPTQKNRDRRKALERVDPTKPQEVARYFKDHGSRFGEADFRGKKAWKDAVERVAGGGPTLEEK